jgi:hypothetical protein
MISRVPPSADGPGRVRGPLQRTTAPSQPPASPSPARSPSGRPVPAADPTPARPWAASSTNTRGSPKSPGSRPAAGFWNPTGPVPAAAGCQRGRLRFHRAAVNASPGPPHLDTSSPNTHPSSQPTPNWMRAVPADQLPDHDRPRTWWGSGSWPVLRWQRSYPPNCARITSWQRARSRRLSCPPGTWVMGVSL